jgi:hypothetical protein
MGANTMFNHAQRIKRGMIDIATNAHLSHAEMMEQRKRLWGTLPKKVPAWVRDNGCTAFDVALAMMYRYEIAWCVMEYRGVRYNDWNTLPEEAKELVRSENRTPLPPELKGFHYWKRTGKRFS